MSYHPLPSYMSPSGLRRTPSLLPHCYVRRSPTLCSLLPRMLMLSPPPPGPLDPSSTTSGSNVTRRATTCTCSPSPYVTYPHPSLHPVIYVLSLRYSCSNAVLFDFYRPDCWRVKVLEVSSRLFWPLSKLMDHVRIFLSMLNPSRVLVLVLME